MGPTETHLHVRIPSPKHLIPEIQRARSRKSGAEKGPCGPYACTHRHTHAHSHMQPSFTGEQRGQRGKDPDGVAQASIYWELPRWGDELPPPFDREGGGR